MFWSQKKPLPEILSVCIVSQRFPLGGNPGGYGHLIPLCKSLVQKGHRVHVITAENLDGVPNPVFDKVHWHNLEGPFLTEGTVSDAVLDTVEALHLEEPFDLIHSVDHSGLKIALHKKELKVALAADVKGTQLDEIFAILGLTEETVSSYLQTSFGVITKFLKSYFGVDHKLLSKADGIFVTSQQQKALLEVYYRIPAKRVHVTPSGFDAAGLLNTKPESHVFEKLGIGAETKVILTASPLIHIQELKNLLSAFERVVVKKPDTALVIIGDGPKKFELEGHMLALALASKVYFLGDIPLEEVHRYINGCQVYVNLYSKFSDFEPTVLEAMACCKTVIASEVGTSHDVISNGSDGFLLRPTEISTLSRLLLDAVSGQLDLQGIGQRARQKVLKMFDTKAMVEETIRAYHEILVSTGKYKK